MLRSAYWGVLRGKKKYLKMINRQAKDSLSSWMNWGNEGFRLKWSEILKYKRKKRGVNNHRIQEKRLIHSVLLLLFHQCAQVQENEKKQVKAINIFLRAAVRYFRKKLQIN